MIESAALRIGQARFLAFFAGEGRWMLGAVAQLDSRIAIKILDAPPVVALRSILIEHVPAQKVTAF